MKIFIYGVPGAGKTYFSKALGKELNLSIFEGDKLKKGEPGTCQAYKLFGDLNEENVIKGLMFVRNALKETVNNEIEKHESLILEAAFLDPNELKNKGRIILVTNQDEKKHKEYFLKHREKLLDFKGNEFKAARIVQEYLIKEAEKLDIEIISN